MARLVRAIHGIAARAKMDGPHSRAMTIKVRRFKMDAMNKMDTGEAKLRYLDGDYEVLVPGSYVACAVTGVHIPLDALRYWSVDLQEPYASPAVSTKRAQEKGLVPK